MTARTALALTVVLAVAACGVAVAPPVSPTATPLPSPTPSPSPTATPTTRPPTSAPAGMTSVAIPAAGISLPVPDAWKQVDAGDLADPSIRTDIAATYPGASRLLKAAEAMGGRATPAFVALDPSAAGTTASLTPNIAVLVSPQSVSGLLLDLVAGFIGSGFADAFEATETERERVQTPVGEAVRLRYSLPGGGTPLEAAVWVIGAPSGTLLVSMMGPVDVLADLDPEAIMAATARLP